MKHRRVRYLSWGAVDIVILGLLLITLSVLAGCQMSLPLPAEPTPLPASPQIDQLVATSTSTTLDPSGQTLMLWHSLDEEGSEALIALIDEFNAENEWDITVTPVLVDDREALRQRLLAAVQVGEPPALVVGSRMLLRDLREVDALPEMTNIRRNERWGLPNDVRDALYLDLFPSGDVMDEAGRVSVPIGSNLLVLFYNPQVLLNITDSMEIPPGTLTVFEDQCDAFLETHQRACYTFVPDADVALNLIWIFGGELIDESGDVAATNEGLHRSLAFMRALADSGYVQARIEENSAIESVLRGETAFSLVSTANVPAENGWEIAPPPRFDDISVLGADGPLLSVLDQAADRELAAWLFVRWYLTTPTAQAKFATTSGLVPAHDEAIRLLDVSEDTPRVLRRSLRWVDDARALPATPAWFRIAPRLEEVAFALLNREIGPEEALEMLTVTSSGR